MSDKGIRFFPSKYNHYDVSRNLRFQVDKKIFFCSKQYVLYRWADKNGNKKLMEDILRANENNLNVIEKQIIMPAWNDEIKEFWRDAICRQMKEDNMMRSNLINTGTSKLAYSHKKDTILGIGCSQDDPEAMNVSRWKGENCLGQLMMEVRGELAKIEPPRAMSSDHWNSDSSNRSWLSMHKGLGDERYTYFWRNESPFSQHHPASFELNGVIYNCAEQYYMAQKAEVFHDRGSWGEIMRCDNPMRQKSIAKGVRGFDEKEWYRIARNVVQRGSIAKYSQNEGLLQLLLATRKTGLVEASPRDRRWGISMEADNPLALSRKSWRGTNWLGEVLTEVRDTHFKDHPYNENFFCGQRPLEYEGFTSFSLPSCPFSPSHLSVFEVKGCPFISLYHFLAHCAASSDKSISDEIMDSTDMKKAERILQKRRLMKYNRRNVITGNYHKFQQNPGLKAQLLSTKDTIMNYNAHDDLCSDPGGYDYDMGWLLTYMRDRWLYDGDVEMEEMITGFSPSFISEQKYNRAKYANSTYQASKFSYKVSIARRNSFGKIGGDVSNMDYHPGYPSRSDQTSYPSQNNQASNPRDLYKGQNSEQDQAHQKRNAKESFEGMEGRERQLSGGSAKKNKMVSSDKEVNYVKPAGRKVEGKEDGIWGDFMHGVRYGQEINKLTKNMEFDLASTTRPMSPHDVVQGEPSSTLENSSESRKEQGWTDISEFQGNPGPTKKRDLQRERWTGRERKISMEKMDDGMVVGDGGVVEEETVMGDGVVVGDGGVVEEDGVMDDGGVLKEEAVMDDGGVVGDGGVLEEDEKLCAVEETNRPNQQVPLEKYEVDMKDKLYPFYKSSFEVEGKNYSSILNYLAFQKAAFFEDEDKMDDINEGSKFHLLLRYLRQLKDKDGWLEKEKELIRKGYKVQMKADESVRRELNSTAGKKLELKVMDKDQRLSEVVAAVLMEIRS